MLAAGATALRAKLDSNEGLFGPTPSAQRAIEVAARTLQRYPDHSLTLVRALATYHGVDESQVLVANGADAIVGHLCTAFLEPGDEVLMGWPSFVTYRLDALRAGAEPVLVPLDDGSCDLTAMAARIHPRTRLIFICNPNNPTGGMVSRADLRAFLDRVPDHAITVVDEAYHEYVADPDYPDAIAEHVAGGNSTLAVLRTFSKIYGLAGLRVGYMVASAGIVRAAGACRHWFDVSDLGHLAARASLDDDVEIARRRERTIERRAQLVELLRDVGLECPAAHGNFVYTEVGDGPELADALTREGILVRSLEAFGAPSAVRITVGSEEEHTALASALRLVEGRLGGAMHP